MLRRIRKKCRADEYINKTFNENNLSLLYQIEIIKSK